MTHPPSTTPAVKLDYAEPRRSRVQQLRDYEVWPIALLIAATTAVEFGCAHLAYHTIGEIVSGIYFALLFANLVPTVAMFFSRRWALVTLLLIALLIVPYQAYLGVRWWRVHRESERIVAYVRSVVVSTGQPPSDLKGYTFRDAGAKDFIAYTVNGGMYQVNYFIGTGTTSHWWNPGAGKWQYYAD
jgi:hypothetical protein